jgi:alanine racemase
MEFRQTHAVVNLRSLRHNLRILQNINGSDSFFCPMVKSNAYGHGDESVAKFLQDSGVVKLGVGQIDEGIRLRQQGITIDILTFSHFDAQGARALIEAGLSPVLTDREQLETFTLIAKEFSHKSHFPGPFTVHLKFDTGMNRVGFSADRAKEIIEHFKKYPGLLQVGSVLTHLFRGDDAGESTGDSLRQLQIFTPVVLELKDSTSVLGGEFAVHALNSAALLKKQKLMQSFTAFDLGARPGLSLYGYSPEPNSEIDLRPVLSVRSMLVSLRKVTKGQTVSYSGTWRAEQDSWIGVLPLGYADGYQRALSNKSSVLVNGERVRTVGNVCMDYLMINVTDLVSRRGADAVRLMPVTLLGPDPAGNCISAHELAERAGTIPWEILTSVAERIPREYTGSQES